MCSTTAKGSNLNPYINYPIREDLMGTPSLKRFVDLCHAADLIKLDRIGGVAEWLRTSSIRDLFSWCSRGFDCWRWPEEFSLSWLGVGSNLG